MTPEQWNTILTVGLLTLASAVAWLIRTVIENKREIATIKAALNPAQLALDMKGLHSRITKSGEALARLEGQIQAASTQWGLINQHLLGKDS
ncbi:MAG: hypothetical protein OXC11_09715 [Rhodospirillales bacterium]|nr:hypothetical protein [Rhodospirillales bacterium]